jgi:hypothetical protein
MPGKVENSSEHGIESGSQPYNQQPTQHPKKEKEGKQSNAQPSPYYVDSWKQQEIDGKTFFGPNLCFNITTETNRFSHSFQLFQLKM